MKKEITQSALLVLGFIQAKVAFHFLESLVVQKTVFDVRLKFVISAEVREFNGGAVSRYEGIKLCATQLR